MSKQDGGSAFPQVKTTKESVTDPNVHSVGGMSLRDYFAAKAMQAALQNISSCSLEDAERIALMTPELAYVIADAMLAERAK